MKINSFVPDSKIFDKIKTVEGKVEEKHDSFSSLLKDKLDEVNDKQISADDAMKSFVKGEGTDVHQVMLSAEEAKLSLQLAVQVRNKLVEAYQELNRMQL